jgi:hypothetical protein
MYVARVPLAASKAEFLCVTSKTPHNDLTFSEIYCKPGEEGVTCVASHRLDA